MIGSSASAIIDFAAYAGNDSGRDITGSLSARDASAPEFDLAALVGMYARLIDGKRLACAFLAWVVYDFAITIDDSIELFWKYHWSISKITFLINRYNILVTVGTIVLQLTMPSPTVTYCKVITWVKLISTFILIAVVDFAMVTRIYALWGRNKKILIFILLFFALHVIPYITIISYGYAIGAFITQEPPFTGCMVAPGYPKPWVIFITTLTFEAVIISLTVYKSWSVAVQRGIRTPLYIILLGDGVAYFLAIIMVHITTFVCVMVPSVLTVPVRISFPFIPVAGIACSRLFIRLQRLLLSNSKGQSGISTEAVWSSAMPEFTIGGGRMDGEPVRGRNGRLHPGDNSTFDSQRGDLDLDDDIAMEKVSKAAAPGRPVVFQEVDAKGDAKDLEASRRSKELNQVLGLEVQVQNDNGDLKPLTDADRRSVLDSLPKLQSEVLNSPGSEDVDSPAVSRTGK